MVIGYIQISDNNHCLNYKFYAAFNYVVINQGF